ncbi:hypothetical protein [Octadecabacter temperatus]|nr:hypothetical protein [Octadecabacter temperatus]
MNSLLWSSILMISIQVERVFADTQNTEETQYSNLMRLHLDESEIAARWQELPPHLAHFIVQYQGNRSCDPEESEAIRYREGRIEIRNEYFFIGRLTHVLNDGSICLSGLPVPLDGSWQNELRELDQFENGLFVCRPNGLISHSESIFARCYFIGPEGRQTFP